MTEVRRTAPRTTEETRRGQVHSGTPLTRRFSTKRQTKTTSEIAFGGGFPHMWITYASDHVNRVKPKRKAGCRRQTDVRKGNAAHGKPPFPAVSATASAHEAITVHADSRSGTEKVPNRISCRLRRSRRCGSGRSVFSGTRRAWCCSGRRNSWQIRRGCVSARPSGSSGPPPSR